MRLFYIIIFFLISLHTTSAILSERALLEIGKKGYIYAFPLVLTHVTQRVMTHTSPECAKSAQSKAPVNQFSHVQAFPTPAYTDIVRPNVDTLYSMAWLDLKKEPIVLMLPDTHTRYYVMQIMDAWTNVFAAPGARTTGTKTHNIALVGPGWHGTLPDDVQKIEAPTNTVWILGRTQTNGVKDYQVVRKIQQEYKLVPLSALGKTYTPNSVVPTGNARDVCVAPVDQVLRMNPEQFFTIFLKALEDNPPLQGDADIIEQLKTIGIEKGKKVHLSSSGFCTLAHAMQEAQQELAQLTNTLGKDINGWRIAHNIGTYGTDYSTRALVALMGVGANLPQDAIYPTAFFDGDGYALHGRYRYVLHFDKDQLPPANAFWSVTLYNNQSFLVENSVNRYALGDRDNLHFNRDGSLDIYIQHLSPGKEKEANWLPAPNSRFNLTMRIYWPKESVLNGSWQPPAIRRVSKKALRR